MSLTLPRILLTVGEPAGIGPDVCLAMAALEWPALIVAVGDPELLRERARTLQLPVRITAFDQNRPGDGHRLGILPCIEVPLANKAVPGKPDTRNAGRVVDGIKKAALACLDGQFDAMVTGPVNKAVINDAGIPFSGHTEMIAEIANNADVVMMLVAGDLRVALATTHLPLRKVPDAITADLVTRCVRIVEHDLARLFAIEKPHILVCGLNPHAGEGGHLGTEDREIILPALERLRAAGVSVTGPVPADTAFAPHHLHDVDAVVAMYHDQGLPVLKHAGFGQAVNITLGLPILRTSVDHGTAFDLAGTGKANPGSMQAATRLAIRLARHQREMLPESGRDTE